MTSVNKDEIRLKRAGWATRLFFFISGFALSSWASMIPYAQERLFLDDADLGLVLFELGIGALLIMPVAGWLVHRYGSRFVCIGAGSLLILVAPSLAAAPTTTSLGALLFLFGMVLGCSNVAANTHAVKVETQSLRPLMSGFHCLFSIGGLSGASLMSILLEMGWPLMSSAYAVSAVIAIVVLTQSPRLLKSSSSTNTAHTTPWSWPSPIVLFLGIMCFIMFLAEGAMLDWSAVFLYTSGNYREEVAGVGYAVFSVAMALGRWSGDWLTQKLGTVNIVQWGGLIAAAGLFTALHADWDGLEMAGFFLVGIGAANIVPLLFSAAGAVPGAPSSFSLTVVTTFGYTGLLLGPALIGFVADIVSLTFALTCVAAMLVFAGLSARILKTQPASYEREVNR